MNLDDLFRETAARQPAHPALVGGAPGESITYRQLDEAIAVAARSLERARIGPGSTIGLHVPSGADYIVWNYAIWRRGGCVVPIPVELTDREKLEICRDIALDAVVVDEFSGDFALSLARGPRSELSPGLCVLPLRAGRGHPRGFESVNAAFIRFTSGTTGLSKGVVLSHETIRDRIEAANRALRLGPADRVVWLLSMSYHFAVSIVGYLTFGATIVLPRNRFAAGIIDATRTYAGTFLYASPMHIALMADFDEGPPLPSLRLAISTAASLDPAIAGRFARRYGLAPSQALGIIEVGLPCVNVDFAAEKPGSVGRVLPDYELRLTDAGLADGSGEIAFRGTGFLDAYYEPWRARDEILPDGWFVTGDVGVLDADGCLHIRGRSTDVVNVMGMKFFPREVEAVLESHPAVAQASLIVLRNGRFGDVPEARVVLRPDAHGVTDVELLRHCRLKLAAFKTPQRIEIVPELDRTASGKLLHRPIAEMGAIPR
ncbi:MAG: class I adenylate-forming enzyme family protein [Planctomycetales bacterium]